MDTSETTINWRDRAMELAIKTLGNMHADDLSLLRRAKAIYEWIYSGTTDADASERERPEVLDRPSSEGSEPRPCSGPPCA